jgi:hypothetical protein
VRPKIQYRYKSWNPSRILAYDTYAPNPKDAQAERDGIYEKALRRFQTKISFERDPLWQVVLWRADTDADKHRMYFTLLIDHLIIDGRGTIKLAKALVNRDISQLPKEDISLYTKIGLGQDMDVLPPYSFIASLMLKGATYPLLPGFLQRWLGQHPVWPEKISKAPIDSPWRSSILDIPSDVIQKLKKVGPKHGVASLNATLHGAWVVTLWALFLDRDENRAQMLKDISVKDLRDVGKGDPYCLGGHPTMYIWSSGLLTGDTRFWAMTKTYEAVSTDSLAHADGTNIMRMANLFKDAALDPADSKHRAPDSQALPVGDKRAHTLREEDALRRINSLSPYDGLSGIWSNLSYVPLPERTIDMVIGCSGTATGTAFNTCVLGHENGARVQSAYADGAAMRERDVKEVERMFLGVLKSVAANGDRDWVLQDLVDVVQPIRPRL